MKKIFLTESQLQYIIENIEQETRNELDSGKVIEEDNFEEMKHIITPSSPDDVFYLQIIKRRKDNPSLRMGNDEYVRYYLIHNYDELMKYKSEIKYLCIHNNARAYITANKRSETNCKQWAQKYIADNKQHRHGKYSWIRGHETEYAFGRSFDSDIERDVVMIDIDTNDKTVHNEVHQILKKYNVNIIMEYPSLNDGLHIFTKSQEELLDAYLAKEFLKFDGGQDLGRLSTVGVDFDKNALVYACLEPQGYRGATNYSQKTQALARNGAIKTRQALQDRQNKIKQNKQP